MHYKFKEDLKQGKEAELELAARLVQVKGVDDIEFNEDKRYDLKVFSEDESYTIEVKWDMKAPETGNVAIEFEYRGNPSGIEASEADFWAYKIEDKFYMLSKDRMSEMIEVERPSYVIGGDPGSGTKMWLVKLRVFKRWAEEL